MSAGSIVLLSHCLLNPHAVIAGRRQRPDVVSRLLRLLLDRGLAIFQLPCPEILHLGARRWAQSVEQYDTPFFRRHCAALLAPVVDQLEEHRGAGVEAACVVGVDGSPTCGVGCTTSAAYGGALAAPDGTPLALPPATKIEAMGVFMRLAREALADRGFDVPFVGFPRVTADEAAVDAFLDRVAHTAE